MSDDVVIVFTMADMPPVTSLLDRAAGLYMFSTESGSWYELDFDASTLTRIRMDDDPATALRRDGEPLLLVTIIDVTVSRPARFWVDLELPGAVQTLRSTTEVLEIIEIRATAESATSTSVE